MDKKHHSEAVKSLLKRCKICIEEFMSSLEVLDRLQFNEHQDIAKGKRKSVVIYTNSQLDNADAALKRIEDLTKL